MQYTYFVLVIEFLTSIVLYINSIKNILPDVDDGTSSSKSVLLSSIDDSDDVGRLRSFEVDSGTDTSSFADDIFCINVTENAIVK